MNKLFYFLLALLPAGILASCDNGSNPEPDPTATVEMVVVSEGGYNKGLATLSAIDDLGHTTYDIFQDVNKRALGDMAQSINYVDGYYYVCLTGKIEVMEPQTFKQVKTLSLDDGSGTGLMPRFVVKTGTGEAIASTQKGLIRIDTRTQTVSEYITLSSLGGRLEKMAVVGGKLFCAAWKEDYPNAGEVGVVVFDLGTYGEGQYRLLTEPAVSEYSKTCKLIVDKNNKLWVVSHDLGVSMTLRCLDPATETVIKTVEIPFAEASTENIGKITSAPTYPRVDTDRTGSKIYITLNQLDAYSRYSGPTEHVAIYTLDVNADAISSEPFRLLPDVKMLYGMGVSPDGTKVYVCDCLDYSAQRGYLREYGPEGTNVTSYRVGIYPRSVHFTEYDK